jgi:hypothetical protein
MNTDSYPHLGKCFICKRPNDLNSLLHCRECQTRLDTLKDMQFYQVIKLPNKPKQSK